MSDELSRFPDLSPQLLSDPTVDRMLKSFLESHAGRFDQALLKKLQTELVIRYAAAERELARLNVELRARQAVLDADLKAAAGIQKALLPQPLPASGEVRAAWQFVPSITVGGDVFFLQPLTEHILQVGVVDISGHGVPSAMVTVSVSQSLQPQMGIVMPVQGDQERIPISPSKVLDGLEREFPFMRFKKTFSIIYGLLDRRTGEFTFSNGGHPMPFLVKKSAEMRVFEEHGGIIGLGLGDGFPVTSVVLEPGDRIFMFTDGLSECRNPTKEFFGEERIRNLAYSLRDTPLSSLPETIVGAARSFQQREAFDDDLTFLALEFRGSPQA